METNKTQTQQDGFDERTMQKIQAYLDEIDKKQQLTQQTSGKINYIKFVSDKERKLLFFNGKFDKREIQDKDFETGQKIPGKYITRYSFECYDVTSATDQGSQPEPSIWERGTKDARIILYHLSKNKRVLEVIRNRQPRSTSTTYHINPPLD